MRPCSTKGCTNPAMGRFKTVSKRGQKLIERSFDMCGSCGFSAHSKRRFMNYVDEETGREVTAFPLQFIKVELERVL